MTVINKKTFNLTNRISKSFDITISNFAFAVTFLFHIRDHMVLIFNMKSISKIFSTIVIKKIRLIPTVKLITKITQTINSRTIKVVYFIRERLKSVTTITAYMPIIITSKARQKIVSIIYEGLLILSFVPTIAQFFTLGDYDSSTLGTMDTSTLGQLDFT